MLVLPDSGVTVWPVRLILDPSSPHPPTQPQNATITNRDPVGDGERRQPTANPISLVESQEGDSHFAAGVAFAHLTQHVTQLLAFENDAYISATWSSASNAPPLDSSLFSVS